MLEMKKIIVASISVTFIIGQASTLLADVTETCISTMVQATAWKPEVLDGQQAAKYDLQLENNTSIDISGAIIEHELWATDRPTALATGYSQSSHTLGGGLLAGETTRFEEYIPLSDHAAKLAEAADSISVRLYVHNIADIQARPVGAQPDPFALWNGEQSTIRCKPFHINK